MVVHKDNEMIRNISNKALTSLYLDRCFDYLDNTYFGLSLARDLNQFQKVPYILLLAISTFSYAAFVFIIILNKKVADAIQSEKIKCSAKQAFKQRIALGITNNYSMI